MSIDVYCISQLLIINYAIIAFQSENIKLGIIIAVHTCLYTYVKCILNITTYIIIIDLLMYAIIGV